MKRNLILEFVDKCEKIPRFGASALLTPDVNKFKMSTPDVEEFLTSERTPTPNLGVSGVTAAQEMYVRGFEKALSEVRGGSSRGGFVELSTDSSTSEYETLDLEYPVLGCGLAPGSSGFDNGFTTASNQLMSTTSHQPMTASHQPETVSIQQITVNNQPITINHQPMNVTHQPTTAGQPEMTISHQPMTPTSRYQPTVSHQPTILPNQPTTAHPRSRQGELGTEPVFTAPPTSPIDLDSQEGYKRERKRLRNRIAAQKCRKKKMEKIARLEAQIEILEQENSQLSLVVSKLRQDVSHLKNRVNDHLQAGCKISCPQPGQPQKLGL